jgi:hypothetical protein
MMLKKIAKIKKFNNFMLRHLVDFKYGIWWYHFWKFSNDAYFSSYILVVIVRTHAKYPYETI